MVTCRAEHGRRFKIPRLNLMLNRPSEDGAAVPGNLQLNSKSGTPAHCRNCVHSECVDAQQACTEFASIHTRQLVNSMRCKSILFSPRKTAPLFFKYKVYNENSSQIQFQLMYSLRAHYQTADLRLFFFFFNKLDFPVLTFWGFLLREKKKIFHPLTDYAISRNG